MVQTRKELLEICKNKNIKGVSKKRKSELLEIIKNSECVPCKFDKIGFLKNISLQILDQKDPITLEPLEEWTDEELQSGILLNQYFYKEDTIKEYVNSTTSNEIRDPIQPQLSIGKDLIQKYRKEEKKLNPSQIKILLDICSFPTMYNNFFFYKFYLQVIVPSLNVVDTNLSFDRRRRSYYLGCIPLNINLTNEVQNPFDMRALDTMSTTDALTIRITNLYENQHFISIKDKRIQINCLEHLPKRMNDWFSITDDFYYINTEPIQTNQPLSTYNKLLQELEQCSV